MMIALVTVCVSLFYINDMIAMMMMIPHAAYALFRLTGTLGYVSLLRTIKHYL